MREELSRQLDASVQRVRDAVAPYDRFVRAERDRLSELDGSLDRLEQRFATLRASIETLGASTAGATGRADSAAASGELR